MTENTSVNETVNKEEKKENFVIIKSGLYANKNNSIVRLVPKEAAPADDHKVRVLIFDEKNIPAEMIEEIAKDRGWEEAQWIKLAEKVTPQTELIQRKITDTVKNSLAFEEWDFVSKKYYPLKKCEKTETWFRATDINQVVCPVYKETLLNDLKKEILGFAKRVDEQDCNINQLWSEVTNFKNNIIELNVKNHLSVRPYKNMRKEIQDIYNKAAQKRDLLKKDWEEKKNEKKKHLNEMLEESKKINEISLAATDVSSEALTLLKNIRQKAKDLETQGLFPPWGVQKLFSTIAPISKREDEKKQKSLEIKREIFNTWKIAAKKLSDQMNEIDLKSESSKKLLISFSDTLTQAKEKEEIGDRELQRLVAQLEDKLKLITSEKEKEVVASKNKEKAQKKMEISNLKELYNQTNKINIGFAYSQQNHELLLELLKASEKIESMGESKKEDIEAYRKQVNEKLKTVESLKALTKK